MKLSFAPNVHWSPLRQPQAPSIQATNVVTHDGQPRDYVTCKCEMLEHEQLTGQRLDIMVRIQQRLNALEGARKIDELRARFAK